MANEAEVAETLMSQVPESKLNAAHLRWRAILLFFFFFYLIFLSHAVAARAIFIADYTSAMFLTLLTFSRRYICTLLPFALAALYGFKK